MLGEKVAPFPAFPQGRNTRETVPAASFFSRSRKFSRKCLFCVFHDRLAEKGTFRPSENQLRGGARGKRRSPARADAGRPDAGNGDAARHLHAAPRRRVPHRSLPRSRRRRTPPRHLPPRRRHHGNGRRNRETLPRAGHLEGRALPEPHRRARRNPRDRLPVRSRRAPRRRRRHAQHRLHGDGRAAADGDAPRFHLSAHIVTLPVPGL